MDINLTYAQRIYLLRWGMQKIAAGEPIYGAGPIAPGGPYVHAGAPIAVLESVMTQAPSQQQDTEE